MSSNTTRNAPSTTKAEHHTKSVYPVVYNRQLQDFDNWDHIIHVYVVGRVSVYDFVDPPSNVLELGCGTGIWVIDAAKRWKSTKFVGFDLHKLQPDLSRCGFTDLAERVQWVHGNFLDRLPFPAGHFEFVRMHCVGLGVPEDKWQDSLQDIYRVLRPGGMLELIEEDQMFPSGLISPDTNSSSSLLQPKNLTSASPEALSPTSSINENLMAGRTEFRSGPPRTSIQYLANPRDHRRIEASWECMLQTRFISISPLSILSFHLLATFDRVEPLPQLLVRLPYNSRVAKSGFQSQDDSESINYIPNSTVFYNAQPMPLVAPSSWDSNPYELTVAIPDYTNALNLARRFYTISACKDAIWDEYEKLYSGMLTSGGEDTKRDEFEFHWSNWVDDMQDRIGMRNIVATALSWPIPPTSGPPASAAWRERCGVIRENEIDEDTEPVDANLCRSLRGFLAWKK